MRLAFVITAKKERLSFLCMTMQINYQLDDLFLGQFENLVFYIIDLRIELFNSLIPSAVEVATYQRASIVAMYDSIGVDHGKDLKDEFIS
jgi:hypothetical protein